MIIQNKVQITLLSLMVVASAALVFLTIGAGSQKDSTVEREVTFLTAPECDSCFSLDPLKEFLSEDLVLESAKELPYDSFRGDRLASKYNVLQAPTLIIEGDNIASIPSIQLLIENGAGEIRDGAFVLTRLQPPFIEIESGDLRGDFEVIYLNDSSCTECYDVKDHQNSFDRLVMVPSKESTIDISSEEGQALVEEYYITAVPTFLLRGDLESYQRLQEIWEYVGTKEEDGTYVLRRGVEDMGIYKRLPDEEIIQIDITNQ